MGDDTYNGWANRETWAFVLHVENDEGLQQFVHEFVRNHADAWSCDGYVGEKIVDAVRELWDDCDGAEWVQLMRDDVGSVWRIDYEEVGHALREAVTL